MAIALGKWLDTLRQKGILNARWDKFIEIQHKVAASLEEIDKAFAESESLRTSLIKIMAKYPTIKDFVESKDDQDSINKIIKFE
jgi:predicted RNA-binding protein with EMAP domain